MKQRTARAGEINGDAIDRWTLGHLGVGFGLGLFKAPWWVAVATAIGWEIIERPIKDRWPASWGHHPTQDSLANSIVDAIAMMTGWGIIAAMPKPTYFGRTSLKPTSKKQFDPRQIKAGTRVEMEHTKDPKTARTIALHHLAEDSLYYTKLCKMWPNESGCEELR